MNAQDFFTNAQKSAELAVRFDTSGQLPAALHYYENAASHLRYAAEHTEDEELCTSWLKKADEYHDRSQHIQQQCK